MERARLAAERRLSVSPGRARDELLTALHSMGGRTVRLTPGTVEVMRGGRVRSVLGATDRALRSTATVIGAGDTARVLMVSEPAQAVDLNASPAALAAEIDDMVALQRACDDVLQRFGARSFGPALLLMPPPSRAGYLALLRQPHVASRVRGQVRLLPAGPAPLPHGVVTVGTAAGSVPLSGHRLRDLLGTAAYIAGHGGALPAGEQAALVEAVAGCWPLSIGVHGGVRLTHDQAEAVNLADRQFRIRATLPARRILRCRDCRFDKIVNPDYGQIAKRNHRLRNAIGIGAAAVMPFATVATVGARVATGFTFDLEYVCPRCQGLEADEIKASICPHCGHLRKEVLLRRCPNDKCRYDLAAAIGDPRPLLLLRTSHHQPEGNDHDHSAPA